MIGKQQFFVFLLMLCCAPKVSPQYAAEANALRKTLGIPILTDDWLVTSVSLTSTTWQKKIYYPSGPRNLPYHGRKEVVYPNGKLTWEQDVYYSGKVYQTFDATEWERIFAVYYYIDHTGTDDRLVNTGWKCTLYNLEYDSGKSLSLNEAEKILSEWGIDRE